MRHRLPILVTITLVPLLLMVAASADVAPVVVGAGRALDVAQTPGPVEVPPGAVVLIRDESATSDLPRHFRTMSDPYSADATAPLPTRDGLDSLRASGSAEFSAEQLQAIVARVGRPLIVVDLRQESHGFLDGVPVSWYALHDQVNVVRSALEAQQDERRRLAALSGAGSVTALVVETKSAPGTIATGRPITLTAAAASTERELVGTLRLGYFRIAATDFLPPIPDNVDRFVAFAAALPPETWLHFHCHAGDGRTTTFLSIWDMLHNAASVGVDDIVRRQALVGPTDLFHVGTPEHWTYPFDVERAHFLRRFHEYARENAATGFVVPWSVWSATRP